MSTILLSVLGGFLALDQTSLGQFMLARPLVSATLAGWLLGSPQAGIAAGAVLEVLFLPAFPVGGARFPEGGPAGVVAASTALAAGGGAVGLALGIGLGAVWGLLGGWTVGTLRRLNERLTPKPIAGAMKPSRIVVGHLASLLMDFLRGTVLTAGGIILGRLLASGAAGAWTLEAGVTGILLGVIAALSLGGLLAGLGGWQRSRIHLFGGLLLGAVVGWAL